MATRVFEEIIFFQEILKRTMARTFEKVNALMDGWMEGRTDARKTAGHDTSPLPMASGAKIYTSLATQKAP